MGTKILYRLGRCFHRITAWGCRKAGVPYIPVPEGDPVQEQDLRERVEALEETLHIFAIQVDGTLTALSGIAQTQGETIAAIQALMRTRGGSQ
jgi:hypothetical protein